MEREIIDNNQFWNLMQEHKEKIISYLRKRYSPAIKQTNEIYYSSTTSSNSFDYSLRDEDYEDIVYDAMITTYENREKGKLKLELLNCKISTYLTRVCIYKANEKLRKNKRFNDYRKSLAYENTSGKINGSIVKQADKILGYCQESEYIQKEIQLMVCDMVRNLPEPCETILWGFYRDNLSFEKIAEGLEKIGNRGSAKVTKHRCMKKFANRLKKIGYVR